MTTAAQTFAGAKTFSTGIITGTLKAGDVTYPNTHGSSGEVLSTSGTGSLIWKNPNAIYSVEATSTGNPFDLDPAQSNYSSLNVLTTNNLRIGNDALKNITNGIGNIAIGDGTMYNTSTGTANVGMGYKSMYSNTTGEYNTAVGSYTLYANSTGYANSSFGNVALVSNTTGNSNSAFGEGALRHNTGGRNNNAFGVNALKANTTGINNIAIGNAALNGNTIGVSNVAIGNQSLQSNISGNYNTVLGFQANVGSDGLSNATAIGYGAVVNASNKIQLGNASVTNVSTAGTITAGTITYPNTAGTNGYVLTTDGSGTASWATAGGGSLVPYTGATGAVNLGAYDLTVNGLTVGKGAGNISTNTATGVSALQYNNSSGVNNTANGYQALLSNTDGYGNTASGSSALFNNLTGVDNTAVGYYALLGNTTGSNNVGIGVIAGASTTTGGYNVSIGKEAMLSNNGNANVAVGAGSIDKITSGNYNVALGGFAGRNYGAGSSNNSSMNNSILIGYDTRPLVNNSSNEIVIGTGTVGNGENTTTIGGANTTATYLKGNVHVSNDITATGFKTSSGTSSEFLKADGTVDGTVYVPKNTTEISIGSDAGVSQGTNAIAIGVNAGKTNQQGVSVAIGTNAGETNQYNSAVAIGYLAGNLNQSTASVAVGSSAGNYSQGYASVAIGNSAGYLQQGLAAVAIGDGAGSEYQGNYSIAIGHKAGGVTAQSQAANSIILNASGTELNSANEGFFVNPIRSGSNGSGQYHLYYDVSSKEIKYSNQGILVASNNIKANTINTGSLIMTSDKRLKTNITSLPSSLDMIKKLNPVSYMKKDSISSTQYTHEEMGFIAQDLQKVIPMLVKEGTDKDKTLSVNYISLIPVLTKAMQEQQVQIEEKAKQTEELKKQLDRQQKEIDELKALIKAIKK